MEARRPRLSLDAFLAREGESFTVHRSDGQDAALRLDAVERPEAHREDRERFTLRFESVDEHVPQGCYRVTHPDLEDFDATIAPVTDVRSGPGSVSYEAVFDRPRSDDGATAAADDGRSSSRRGILAGALGALLGGNLLAGLAGSPAGTASAQSGASDPIMGEIRAFGFDFPPRGWVKCDGQTMPVSQHSALFSLLGTRYGGDGRTTFRVPDLRGRTPIHHGQGPGPNRQLGESGGNAEVALGTANLPEHAHGNDLEVPVSTAEGNAVNPDGNALAAQPDARGTVPVYTDGATDGSMDVAGSVESTGSGQPYDNMPPFTAVNYCIATVGIYPSRD